MPFSRSVAMVMARYWKLVDMRPPAIMPAVNSWPTVTPWAAAWLPKIDPSRTSRIDGSPKMNATAILSRKNVLTSTPPRAIPSRHAPGSSVAAPGCTAGPASLMLGVMTAPPDRPPRLLRPRR